MKCAKKFWGIVVFVSFAIVNLNGCATIQTNESAKPLLNVNKIEKWKYKKCFDCPEFSPTIKRAKTKGKRYYINLQCNETVGKFGIGEEYSSSDFIDKISKNGPLNTFLKEKMFEYRDKVSLKEITQIYDNFLKDIVIITLTAEFKPWKRSYSGWIPHAKIRVYEKGKNGKWEFVPQIVRERINNVAKSMYESGYINELKNKRANPSKMDIAIEGQYIFVYGIPENNTCHEINVQPSRLLDSYLK
jgi:hypothetical protein